MGHGPGARSRRRSIVVLGLLATLPAVAADTAEVVAGLQGWLDGTRQLEARFEQSLLSGALGAGLTESGRLYVERPGRMRWDYRDPERKTALIDGDRMELYLHEDRQLLRSQVPEDGGLLPTLLAGEGRVGELFEAALLDAEADGSLRLELRPRNRSETFDEAVLFLAPNGFAILGARVLDAAGNEMEYRFSSLRRNRGLPRGVFAFEPPAGTEIVDP